MSSRLNLYLAAPLFNKMELNYNASLKEELSPYFDVFFTARRWLTTERYRRARHERKCSSQDSIRCRYTSYG